MTIQTQQGLGTQTEFTERKEETLDLLKNLAKEIIIKICEIKTQILEDDSETGYATPKELKHKIKQLHSESASNIRLAANHDEINDKYFEFIHQIQKLQNELPEKNISDQIQQLIKEHNNTFTLQQTLSKCTKKFREYIESLENKLQLTHKLFFTTHTGTSCGCFKDIKASLENINSDFDTQLMLIENKQELQELLRRSINELNKNNENWPLAFHRFREIREQAQNKINTISTEYKVHLNDKDGAFFKALIDKIDEIIKSRTETLMTVENDLQKNQHIFEGLEQINEVIVTIEIEIKRLSLLDFRDKIIARSDNIQTKFPDLNLEETIKILKSTVDDVNVTIAAIPFEKEKSALINTALDKLQELDMEIEKRTAIREIQFRCEEILSVINRYESPDLSLKPQRDYIMEGVSSCTERLSELHISSSSSRLNESAQLFVIINGTMSALERGLKEIYRIYGKSSIESIFQNLPHTNTKNEPKTVDPEGEKNLNVKIQNILEKFEDEITWGDDDVPRACPPLLSEQKMVEIIQTYKTLAKLEIYLCYFEQRLAKSLKFFLLRKQWEGINKEEYHKLESLGKKLCEIAKEKASQILNDNATLPQEGLQQKIDTLIGEYMQEIQQLKK